MDPLTAHRITAIHSATAQLASLTGSLPRVAEEGAAVRIEVAVTPALRQQWKELLRILDLGNAYGLTDSESGQIAWLRFDDALGQDGP